LGLFSYNKNDNSNYSTSGCSSRFCRKQKSIGKNIFKPGQKYYSIDDEYNAQRKERQDEIDRLLSKIGKNGLNDLTQKERKRLDELSKK
jgi:hypothetical protein